MSISAAVPCLITKIKCASCFESKLVQNNNIISLIQIRLIDEFVRIYGIN